MTEAEDLEKYREAGRILAEVRTDAIKTIKVGKKLLDAAESIENLIQQKGGAVAFPTNISVNEEAAHATPSKADASTFGTDLVKLDIGVHIDGYIADTAVTIDLGNNKELVDASNSALERAIEVVRAGVDLAAISEVIEDTITDYGTSRSPISQATASSVTHNTRRPRFTTDELKADRSSKKVRL